MSREPWRSSDRRAGALREGSTTGTGTVLTLLVTAEKLVAAATDLQDRLVEVLAGATTGLLGMTRSVAAVETALASAAGAAGAATRKATGSTVPVQPYAEQLATFADAALSCGEAYDAAAQSAKFQFARRAALRTHLERIPHHLRAIRQANDEMRMQRMGADAAVQTLGRRLDLSVQIHRALDSGEKALSDLCVLGAALFEPERIRSLHAGAGREVCRAAAFTSKRPTGEAEVCIAGNESGLLVVSRHQGNPEIARVFPAPGLNWSRVEKEVRLCFELEERVVLPGILAVIRPAIAVWNIEKRHGNLAQRGMLRWRPIPTLRSNL